MKCFISFCIDQKFLVLSCSYEPTIFLFLGGGAKQKSPAPAQPLDPAYSQILKQQQVFLQLQILQNQQQQQQQQQQLQPQHQLAVVPRYVDIVSTFCK